MWSPLLKCMCKRSFSGHSVLSRSHYDVLGITPKATQSEVKTAYYKLSKVYHPDMNLSDVNAAQKFRNINEAYEVLGNVRLRKLYDKGMYHVGGVQTYHDDDDPTTRFYRSREVRTRPPPPGGGRTPVYDFDEWSRSHYGATFERDQRNKARRHDEVRQRMQHVQDVKLEKILMAFLVTTLIATYLASNNYMDNVKYQRPSDDESKK